MIEERGVRNRWTKGRGEGYRIRQGLGWQNTTWRWRLHIWAWSRRNALVSCILGSTRKTMAYPPTSSHIPTGAAEEYELQSPPNNHIPLAGPSRPKLRTLSLHPSASTSALLFPAGTAPPQHSPRRRRSSTLNGNGPGTPKRQRAHFLQDERDSENIHVPDIGHMFGIDDTSEDHFATAANMRSMWKKRLYLLMEEPSSGREAFMVHVLVTGAIIFR